MSKPRLIPEDVQLAAKRGFIRTTFQAYATALAGGITTTGVLAYVEGSIPTPVIIATVVVTALSPLLAGAGSYFSIVADGLPAEYAAEPRDDDGATVGWEDDAD